MARDRAVKRRRLIREDADRRRRLARQRQARPDLVAADIPPERPGDFLVGVHLRREHERRGDVVASRRRVADANLPRKFPEHERRRRDGRLEVPVLLPAIRPRRRAIRRRAAFRQRVERRHDIPMSRVLGEVAKFAIRVEEQVLAPLVRHIVDDDLADLEADDFTLDIEQLASGSQRNERLLANRIGVLLQDGDAGIGGVENRAAALADDVDGVAERADRGRGPAVGTVDGAHADRPATLCLRHVTSPRTCGRSSAATCRNPPPCRCRAPAPRRCSRWWRSRRPRSAGRRR